MERFVKYVCIGTFVPAIILSIISLVGSCSKSYVNSCLRPLVSLLNTVCWSFCIFFPWLSLLIPFVQDFFGFAVACVYVAMIMGMTLFIGVGTYRIDTEQKIKENFHVQADDEVALFEETPTRDFGEVVMIFIIIFFTLIFFAMTPFGELTKSAILEILERRF